MSKVPTEPKKEKLNYRKLFGSTYTISAILALITFAVFYQFFFNDGMLFSSDQMSGFDSKVFLENSIKQYHQFPLWFNSRLSGMPTIDAMFGDAFYPPSIVVGLLLPIYKAISFKMILHVFLAGLFFFLMLRKGFKLPPLLSFIGGVFFMLCPQFLSHIYPGHDGKMYVIALLPFIIWRLKVLMETPSIFNASLLSVGIGMSLLTSHVQMNYFVMWGLFFYWVITAAFCFFKEHDIKRGLTVTGYFWFAVIIGLLIGLIQLLPPFMYTHDALSVRGVDKGFEFASSWSLHWPEVFSSLWVPEFVNSLDYYWGDNPFKLNSEYIGALTVLLAALAVIRKPDRWRIFWAGVAGFALLFALGAHTPLFHIAYCLVPGVKKFRANSMIMFWFAFISVLLSVLFLKDVFEGTLSSLAEANKKRWVKGLLITNGIFLLLSLIFSNKGFVSGLFSTTLSSNGKSNVFDANFTNNFVPFLWLWFLGISAVLFMLIGVITNKLKPVPFIVIIFLAGIFDMLRVDSMFIKMTDAKPYFYEDQVVRDLESQMKTAPFRCYSLPGALPQNGEGIHNLEGVNGFHDNELRWYRDFRGNQNDQNYLNSLVGFNENGQPFLKAESLPDGNAFLDLANVKYLLVRAQDNLLAIENKNALGRVSFASNCIVMDSTKITEAISKGEYDYRNTVALVKKPPVGTVNVASQGTGSFSADWEKYTPNYRKVKVNVPNTGFLRISEVYYPGWEVRIDGKKTDVYQADLAWMAVPVSAGNHSVEIIAHSMILGKIIWVSLSVILVLCLYWIWYALSYRKRNRA